jgi:YggT family protein|tara:strand:+ start:1244 stop:1807 length:564 start_codon:yes stop_codon:yes gene_type:complete
MFGNILHFIINILFTLFGIALLIRAWMFAIRLHPFNPYSQALLRMTDWLVVPLKRVIPSSSRIDGPSIVAAWLIALIYLLLTFFVLTGALPLMNGLAGALIASVLTVLKWAFNLVLWLTLIQVILSWVNPMAPIMPVLQTLTAPLLDPIRRVLPNLGGIDFSPLVLLILAQVIMMVLESMAFSLFGV